MAIIVKEVTMVWCSHCSNISRTRWEGNSQCCLDCGKILGQIFLGKFIREGRRRKILSRTGGRRQRRRGAATMTVEEQQIVPAVSETDSS